MEVGRAQGTARGLEEKTWLLPDQLEEEWWRGLETKQQLMLQF